MNSPGRIAEAFLAFSAGDFWKLYKDELSTYMSTRMDKLRNDPIDKILHTQGEVKSLEWVAKLPDRILSSLAEQTKKGE